LLFVPCIISLFACIYRLNKLFKYCLFIPSLATCQPLYFVVVLVLFCYTTNKFSLCKLLQCCAAASIWSKLRLSRSQDGPSTTPPHKKNNTTRFLLMWKCKIQNKIQFNKTIKRNTPQHNHNTPKKGGAESRDQSARMGGPVNHRSRSKSA